MKRYAWVLGTLLLSGFVRADTVQWQQDYDKALASARESKKLVVVDLYTDWCGWCKKLDKDVYANAIVSERLSKNFVTVKINPEKSSRAAQLAKQFGTRGYPHIVFVNADGKKIGEIGGYVPADEFLKKLDKVAGTTK
jgi:thioredoxin-related protein